MSSPSTGEQSDTDKLAKCDQLLRVMTAFLRKVQVEKSQSYVGSEDSLNTSKRYELCQHLATIFTTSREDVVAVTGMQTTRGLLSAILFTRNPVRLDSEDQPRERLVVQELHATKENYESILRGRSTDHTFESNVQDWTQIITSCEPRFESSTEIAEFVLYRSRLRIGQRLSNGKSIWNVHPMETLQGLVSGDHTKALPEEAQKAMEVLGDKIVSISVKSIFIIYMDGKIEGESLLVQTGSADWDHVKFGATTAIHWLHFLVQVFITFRSTFLDLELGKKPNPSALPGWDKKRFASCAYALIAFRDLLHLTLPIDEPKKSQFLFRFMLNALSDLKGFIQKPQNMPSEDDALDDLKLGDESQGHQVFRYLRTIGAHVTSARAVVKSLHGKVPSTVTLLEYPRPKPTLHQWAIDKIRQELQESLRQAVDDDQEADIMHFFDDRIKAINLEPGAFPGSVHAEAALMGLAIAKYRNEPGTSSPTTGVNQDQKPLFDLDHESLLPSDKGQLKLLYDCLPSMTIDRFVIGVVKNCCSTCKLLHQALEAEHSQWSPKPTFELPGSHGMAYPWALPSIGVSLRVAEDLVGRVKTQFINYAFRQSGASTSRQSSEASDEEEDVSSRTVEEAIEWLETRNG